MTNKKFDTVVLSSNSEKDAISSLTQLLRNTPIPDDELLANIGIYLTSKNLARLLFFYEIYKRIVNHHGIICEFGVRWGQTLSLLSALRGIYEPFNRHRKIVGFDTFEGFSGVDEKDGKASNCSEGSFSVPEGYEKCLADIMAIQEALNPLNHLKRFELVKGDAVTTVPEYFTSHPETIISLAIFDFDIYKPTKVALTAILPYLHKGSILVFDELCDDIFPGETIALREVFDMNKMEIQRLPMTARISYIEL